MKYRGILTYLFSIVLVLFLVYISACDSGGGITSNTITNPPPPSPNPYGSGNGKITFIRKQQIDGPVTIKISDKSLNDSLIWQMTPPCDTNIAASQILKAGSYSVRIEGSIFMCNYNVTVEERICKILDYTNCSGGSVGCTDITGVWLRTADGPCPNCRGLKVEFRNGSGEVVFTPQGCRFPLGDIKWSDFNVNGCTMLDLARDKYGGSPQYQSAVLTFENKNSFIINSESGVIPYTRIALKYDKKISKNIVRNPDRLHSSVPAGMQVAR
jgi:hypothetical protein